MTEPAHKLGEVLRAAREAKGIDLVRVERETKIRERYLSALERGEYRELPGAVYTKGFLRNYGSYLGLDPEYLIDLYRIETAAPAVERPRVQAPRPLSAKRTRTFVVTPGAIVAAILTVLVGGFIMYLGYQLVNFARMPELRITDPVANVNGYASLSITLRGVTEPNAKVRVDNLRENPSVTADANGNFEVTVSLVPGSNVVELVADDPVTGRTTEPEQRTILVASDTPASPSLPTTALSVTEPAADATSSGEVPIAGTAAPGAVVTVSATLVEAAPRTFAVSDPGGGLVDLAPAEPATPEPLSLTSDAGGAFTGELRLPSGTWDVVVATEGAETVTRRVNVSVGDGLRVSLRTHGGESYVELDRDGAAVADVSGGILGDGETVDLEATDAVRIRAGNAGAVRVTVNGIEIGPMGGAGEVVEWRITRSSG